jgi:hypothetical protein
VRLDQDPALDPMALARLHGADFDRVRAGLAQLGERGLVQETAPSNGHLRRDLTPVGRDALCRLAAARRARLEELFAEWAPEKRAEIAATLQSLARQLVPEPVSAASSPADDPRSSSDRSR